MGATLLKGQGCIVCTHIKEKLGMFLCSDLVRKYYIMQFPSKWRHPTSSKRRGGISAGSPRNNKIHLNSLPMSYQFFEIDYDPWWLLRYLDQLGMASKYNTKVFCTQTLIGGNYGGRCNVFQTWLICVDPSFCSQCSAMASALLWDHKLNVAMIIATFSAVGGQIWCITENHTEREHFVDEIPKSSSESLNALACTNEAERPNTQKGKGTEDIRLIQFKEWMDEYNIQYPDEETARSKFSIFKANVELHG
ncbi:uncharacterized protein [Triticum aestivum]|uniref:uncharacterized protein n=1 Tax=Triticum aestivum TaxID=4565 RepID=UPI001D019EE8|nr:uncharacterized protein LOC123060312 [Triticum aestivum]